MGFLWMLSGFIMLLIHKRGFSDDPVDPMCIFIAYMIAGPFIMIYWIGKKIYKCFY